MTAPTTRETADHAELARLAAKLRETKYRWTMGYRDDVLLNPDGPKAADALETLLSEIAALRGRENELIATHAVAVMRIERQRDELRKALEPFAEAAESLDDETRDHDHIWEQPAAMSIDAGHLRTARALIANQGADQ